MTPTTQQFRPAFTAAQILSLTEIIATSTHPDAPALHKKLQVFAAKISVGAVSPAYENTGTRTSLLDSLGGTAPASKQAREARYEQLARIALESPEKLTDELQAEGKELEIYLFGTDLGTFSL